MSTNPIYSQSFNFNSFIQKGVDPRTGQYTCTVNIYETPTQARNCPSFKLSLTFNPLNTQNVGLGQGWSFTLPSYEHRQANPTVNLSTGESYQVTETSGSLFTKDQKLKSSQVKKLEADSYQFTYKSGQIEILSNFNNSYKKSIPVELYATAGRCLSFTWVRSGEQPLLEKIQQGSEVLLEVKYEDSQTEITRAPNTSEASTFILTLRNNQLDELCLPLEGSPSWKFVYTAFGHLQNVTSPSGLIEELQYKEQGHRMPPGAPYQAIPYVISHTARPGNGQPPIKDGEDNLYLTLDDYQYTATVQVEGGAETKHTYNKYHLLISSEQQKGTKQIIQTITYHAIPFVDFEDQPAQYQLPKTVETTYQDTVNQASRIETSHQVFDDWGNPTQEIKTNGITTNRVYYLPTGEDGCPADPHGFQRYIKTETVIPAASSHQAPTRIEYYTYSQIPTATGAKTSYFVAVQQRQTLEDGQLLTTTDHSYINQTETKDHGRLQQQVTRLIDQYPTTQGWTYTYPDSNQLKQARTTTTFDASTVGEGISYSMWSGLALTHESEVGISDLYTYDNLGRLIKAVTSPGTPFEAVIQNEYTFLGDINGSRKTVTDAKGVQTHYITDGLERLNQVEKQDDTGTFRLIQENSYNAQGQRITTAEVDWFQAEGGGQPTEQQSSKSMEYDDWGKLCKVTESSGLVTLSLTDPITQTKIEGIEGEGMVKTQLNIFDVPVQTALCKSDDTVYSKIDYTYDGLGRLVSQTDQLGRTTEYKADSFDRIVETIWPNNRVVKTQYANQTTAVLPMSMELNGNTVGEQSFDGLGRVTRRTVGTRTTSQSYEGVSPEPACITSPRGDQHNLTYEPALDYVPTGLTRSDNLTTDTYQYDAQTAVPIQFMNSYSTNDLQYFPSGLLSQEKIQTSGGQVFSAEYIYSMSGKLQHYTDVNGKTHEIQYDACGRPQTIVQGQLKVSLVYDNASRVSESCVEDGASNSQIKLSLSYDDFGREIKRSVSKGGTTLLYHLSQAYGESGLITSRRKEEGNGDVSRDESFEYDIHNRLVNYKCQGNQPPTDQQGHQLQSQGFIFDDYDNISQCLTVFQNGSSNTAVYSFSAREPTQLIKITNTHPDYPPGVDLDYGENGCLARDEQGRILQYNNMSRLIAVSDANNQILAEYQYDGTGKLVCQQVPGEADTCLFYRDSLIVAVCKGDRKTSFLSNESEYWGETISENNQITTNLWASDGQQSITTIMNTGAPDQTQHREYTPYCFSDLSAGASIGFNGQWRDPVTGWYHLGNGYRVYNPVLMRFHTPDPSSPFTSGEINPYSYCLRDPINQVDPSGHFSLFGIHFGFKDLIMAIFGIIVGIAVGILTAGAGFAIEVGVGLAAGVASDVTSGVIGDLAEGKGPTWKSVGMDALGGLIGGIGGELGGAVLKQGMRMVKAAPMVIKRALGRSGSAAITKPLAGEAGKSLAAIAKSSIRGAAREFIPAQVAARGALYGIDPPSDENSESQAGSQALPSSGDKVGAPSKPLGNHGPAQIGSHPFYFERGSSIARDTIRPAKKEGVDASAHIMTMLTNSYGSETGAGQSFVTNLLNREARVAYGPLTADPSKRDSGSKQH